MCVKLTQQLINNSYLHDVYINSKEKKIPHCSMWIDMVFGAIVELDMNILMD